MSCGIILITLYLHVDTVQTDFCRAKRRAMSPFVRAILLLSCAILIQARIRPVEHPVLDESGLKAVPCPTKKKAHGKDCLSGKCLFRGCTEPTDCGGGKCLFVECEAPACSGGGCTFESCHAPTCVGGLCTFLNTQTTLADGYCAGGEWEVE